MKNILILITKGETGGAQVSVFNLANTLKKKGYRVTVGFGQGTFLQDKLATHNIPYHQFKHLLRTHNPLSTVRFIYELRVYLKQHSFTSLHCNSSNTLPGVLATFFLRQKPTTIFTFRGLSLIDKNYQEGNRLLKTLYSWYFKFFLHFTDHCVLVSKENMDQIKTMKLPSHTSVIYNGLDPKELNFFDSKEARTVLKLKTGTSLEGKFIIGSIGRLSYQKNYEFLIQHWPQIQQSIPNALLVIIGGGPDEEKLHAQMLTTKGNEQIHLLGDMPDAYTYLRGFDCFVLPSRYEGLSIVLLETLFAGTPVIATDVNSNAEVLGNAGLVYPLDNIDIFLTHIQKLTHREIREEMSRQATLRSNMFHIENTVDGYLKLYT